MTPRERRHLCWTHYCPAPLELNQKVQVRSQADFIMRQEHSNSEWTAEVNFLALYSFAFQAARSALSSGRSRPSHQSGQSWNHFSRLQKT